MRCNGNISSIACISPSETYSVPAMLSTGEHVLTAREVDALGGHAAVYRLRAAALAGQVQRFAAGGPVTGRASLPDKITQTFTPQPAAAPQPTQDRRGDVTVRIGQIVNPISEPLPVTINRSLQRAAALAGGMI